ncbi:fimbria/pilus periplasmic chaperone [Enterobacter cancerogenus]|uniref:fimbria/pilus periplasmic chaperone n=1 Tax=Enterobacter cancerogenus TaxID=69218 RepID=UPI000733EFE2|nr:fimbria/pilus periplasmic chaperone [Enterobacter cancerogenus]KTQ46842.1 molecular chaperone [Enterobacter cancerogenus]KTQ49128.1 molecular chaperone [Enterobacter cancerogenus]KTQ69256.1 molecular chaperone [Enterobacter cancerogenus]KTQ80345.1 molecular chaperone [Enterobacter cancerogenus]
MKYLLNCSLFMGCLTAAILFNIVDAKAAISLDRTRIIMNGDTDAISISVSNNNKELPYLAQAWLEDEAGKKIHSPITVLPPVQRIEPGKTNQIRLQSLSGKLDTLPQEKESLFYFNLREIPPRSDKPNTLQIALQTKIKLFYRPASIIAKGGTDKIIRESVQLSRLGGRYIVNNRTPYYLTIVEGAPSEKANPLDNFSPVMIAPQHSAELNISDSALGNTPVLTYVNDYGAKPKLYFKCQQNQCTNLGA